MNPKDKKEPRKSEFYLDRREEFINYILKHFNSDILDFALQGAENLLKDIRKKSEDITIPYMIKHLLEEQVRDLEIIRNSITREELDNRLREKGNIS
jgi:hypothetical protein